MVKNKILKRIVAGLSCIALSTTMLTSLPAFADDYVDEYQYYSTLDPNGEEYQEWKSNLASSAVSVPQNRMLKSILKNCSYYYTNSEVHEGNNFKFDPLTSVGNPILLAQFADDNYDCKINSLADQNTDIMCNIDGNIYLYTNISVNSGSVLFLNLSDGSFFINIDLDNDGEIDTTVTPTINPGVIQDDEKSPEITVESCNAGISNSNTINPNIVITNNSDKPLKMSDITINYVFNADNKENLEYHCDWLAVDNQYLGNTSVCEFVNDDYGNTYAKIKFNTDVELQPNKQFVIHFRLNAADWSNWDTSNDYSMGTEQLLPNDKIIVFYNEQLISGVQP